MTVDIELDGRRRSIQVRRDGDRWVVSFDGREVSATIAEIGGRWSLLAATPEGVTGPPEGGHNENALTSGSSQAWRSYEVAFEPGVNGEQIVHVGGVSVPLTVIDPRARFSRRGHDLTGGHAGPKSVVAPMPGRIVKLLVKPGDAVAARQGVVVVEAMKMENELRAPKAGTVSDVRVSEGASVEAHAVLVVIE